MLKKMTTTVAAAVLVLAIPAGAALATDGDAITDDTVVTCDHDQARDRARDQTADGTGVKAMNQERQQLHMDGDAECDGPNGQGQGNGLKGAGQGQGNGPNGQGAQANNGFGGSR
ncbi:MAG: hypothetical protein KJP12_02255 [Acidimicrobiia bacterium]|nr:hypothetical protein [Acidimicrobiia bacterium]